MLAITTASSGHRDSISGWQLHWGFGEAQQLGQIVNFAMHIEGTEYWRGHTVSGS